jgi:hypothetical protein
MILIAIFVIIQQQITFSDRNAEEKVQFNKKIYKNSSKIY